MTKIRLTIHLHFSEE